jgi:hypothetical protein
MVAFGVFGGYGVGVIFESRRSSFKVAFNKGYDLCKRLDQETIDNLRKQLNYLTNGG